MNDTDDPCGNDIRALVRRLPGLDASRYHDEQARQGYAHALAQWPVLATLMGLAPADETPLPPGARQ